MTTYQYGATIQKPILPGRVEPLRTLLGSIGDNIESDSPIPFTRLTAAHFLCWFIVDQGSAGPLLFFELNVDGPIEPFLHDLVAQAGPGLDLILDIASAIPRKAAPRPGKSSST